MGGFPLDIGRGMDMNDLNEQYNIELGYQEKKSNVRTLKSFLWFFIAMAVIWVLTAVDFFVIDTATVTLAFSIATALMAAPLVVSLKGNLEAEWVKYMLLAVLCCMVGVINAILAYHAVFLFVMPLIFAIQYRKKAPLWYAYIVNCFTMAAGTIFAFYKGICDVNLIFDGNHSRDWYMSHYDGIALTAPLNENPLFVILVFAILPRCMVLLIFTITLRYIIMSNAEDAKRIAELTYRKETDIRTKLFSKNKYEEMIASYYPGLDKVAVIFWDLNNLKLTNDRYGHAEGDALIDKMSTILHAYMYGGCRVYRVGGDEFVMIIDNADETQAKEMVASVRKRMSEMRTDNAFRISSAVGYAVGVGKNIRDVVKQADENMYIDKARCKQSGDSISRRD